MTPPRSAWLVALAFAGARPAVGGVEVTLQSYLSARPEVRDGRAVTAAPLLELVTVNAWGLSAPGVKDARVLVSGWGRLGLFDLSLSRRGSVAGDLDLALVEGRLFGERLRLVAGRQLVVGGAARFLHLDGLLAEYVLPRRLRLAAWGGLPVSARFGVRQGDGAAGGRVAWAPSWDSEVGASYALVMDRGLGARHDVAVDGRWAPANALRVSGHALFSVAEIRLVEAELAPYWRVLPTLELGVSARRVAQDLLLPRSSILSVFAEPERDEVGMVAIWEPRPELAVTADVRAAWLAGSPGSDAGARLVARPADGTFVTGELRWLGAADRGYLRARLGASRRITGKLVLAADADAFWRDRPVNGVSHSAVAAATATWAVAPEWLMVAELGAGTTPEMLAEARAMVKLAWRWNVSASDRSAP